MSEATIPTSEEFSDTGVTAEALHAMIEESLQTFTEGSIVEGRVLEKRPNEIVIDIGYKSEGIIHANEFKNLDEIEEGDTVEVLLLELEDENDMVVLSKQRAELQQNWDRILETCNEGDLVEGLVHSRVKGGMLVDVGVEAFLPGSQIDIVPVRTRTSSSARTSSSRSSRSIRSVATSLYLVVNCSKSNVANRSKRFSTPSKLVKCAKVLSKTSPTLVHLSICKASTVSCTLPT